MNEHTGGCSPAVLEAIRRVGAEEAARYPDCAEATRAAAAHFGVPADRLLLTNGLDEGLLLASLAAMRVGPPPGEAVVVEPAFEMYAQFAGAAGATCVRVPPRPGFEFPLEETLAAISPATRIVFLTDPNNPTGQRIAPEAIRRIARSVPPMAYVVLDEAYAEFSRDTFMAGIDELPNLLVGRTFAKAYGLAGLRAGALVGRPERLDPIRRLAPPYSVNAIVAAALGAALADRSHVERYLAETEESKRLVYAACDRLGLRYWPSAANFVLIRVGDRLPDLVARLADRGIAVRDRSGAPGCAGCVRITTGLVADTTACLAALEEILCPAGA